MGTKVNNHKATVKISEDYIVRDPDEIQKILNRVSKIISNSYIRQMKENHGAVKAGVA